jgi:RNA polymerase sigma-70 factor (ECF subfamily)
MDVDLVIRAQAGDEAAFQTLAAAIAPRSMRVAQGILREPTLAEDAMQQALVRTWRQLPSLRDPARFEAWSLRILVNTCNRQARTARRTSPLPPDFEPAAPEALGVVLDRDRLDRAFARLPLDQRSVLVLHLYLGYANAETAAILGIPEGTVRSRLYHGLRAMRASLDADDRSPSRLTMGRSAAR